MFSRVLVSGHLIFRILLAGFILVSASAFRSSETDNAAGLWLELTGVASIRGVEQPLRMVFAGDGRFRVDIDGLAPRTLVYDGQRLWRQEAGAPAYELELFERELALLSHWLISNDWQLGNVPLRRSHGAGSAVRMQLRDGILGAVVQFERGYVPTRVQFPDYPDPIGIRYSGRLELDSLSFPERVVWSGTGPDWQSYSIEQVQFVPIGSDDYFDANLNRVTDFRFDHAITPELETHRLETGHMLIKVRLNDAQDGWFLFDTGAATSHIDAAFADSLSMPELGDVPVGGVGGYAGQSRLRRADSIQIGQLTINNLNMVQALSGPGSMLSDFFDEPILGTIGWDILIRSTVIYDMQEGSVSIRDPDAYSIPQDRRANLTLHWKVPFVTASFEGDRSGLFMLDTGAGSMGVIFPNHSVERLSLLEGRETRPVQAQGIGGPVEMVIGSLDWVELAGSRSENVPAAFSIGFDGESDPYSLGILGGSVVGAFNIVLDYRNGLVGFIPRE